MYKSVFSKYLTIISLVIVVGFMAMTMFQVVLTANALADEKHSLLVENARNIAQHTASTADVVRGPDGEMVYRLDGSRLSPLLAMITEAVDATVLITDDDGRVLLAAGDNQCHSLYLG